MPKRKSDEEEKIRRYRRKLRKLEEGRRRKYNRILYSSEDSDNNSDEDNVIEPDPEPIDHPENICNEENKVDGSEELTPELDPDILSALGETTEEAPKFGPKIHEKLSRLWVPILKKGINKDLKEKLTKEYIIPENCQFLQAPRLNPEISAAIAESTRTRDKRVEAVQQQLGQGITALNKGLELLLDDGKDRLQAIKYLSDSCRILCDLHYTETQARKKFITPGLEKGFLTFIQDVERDDLLFGNKLSEKIKATKVIEKQGLQIKKPPPNVKTPSTSSNYQPSTSRSRQQGNWTGPPRFSSNRGGRGGHRGRGASAVRRTHSTPAQQKPPSQSKQPRATGQQ